MNVAAGKPPIQGKSSFCYERTQRAIETITNTARDGGLANTLTTQEMEMLKKEPGTWEYEDLIYGNFWESLGVLTWLLGRSHEIPPYYSNFNKMEVFNSTGILPGDPKTIDSFVNSFMAVQTNFSVNGDDLKREIDLAEAWYWRARVQSLIDMKHYILENEMKDIKDKSDDIPDQIIRRYMRERHIPLSLKPLVKNIDMILHSATKRGIEMGLLSQINDEDFGIQVELFSAESPSDASEHPNIKKTPTLMNYSNLESKDHKALMNIAEGRMMAFAWATQKLDQWSIENMSKVGSVNPLNILWSPEN
ncbi:hypothetical protein BB560_004235 [Smittium megazygosporum]|uniref:Uncharacterized protein n=1 Tax=Smittium megazygosporum TaxID=133381 RepID=A0A2T9Z9S2_9FUNG|nr:hypothetical protein BB560_004235 [Smittium megazygosporum]